MNRFRNNIPVSFSPVTKTVKILMVSILSIWFVGNIILEQYLWNEPKLTLWLGLTPYSLMKDFFIWQPFSYIFIHDPSPLSMVFNMLLLWWLGSELETLWGRKFFLLFFFVCSVGTAFLYSFIALIISIVTSQAQYMMTPVTGVSAALFGLMVAYGILFGNRTVSFMFFFPMQAKYFIWILIGIEVIVVLNQSSGYGRVASLSHLGGALVGYLFLLLWPFLRRGQGKSDGKKKKSKNLRLVVNNTDFNEDKKPKYWH